MVILPTISTILLHYIAQGHTLDHSVARAYKFVRTSIQSKSANELTILMHLPCLHGSSFIQVTSY